MTPRTHARILSAVVLAAGASGLVGGCGLGDSIPRGADSILAAFQPPSPQEAANLALDPYSADNRFQGVQLLSNAPFGGQSVYVQLYRDALRDPDPGVRWIAARALGRHGEIDDVPALIERLRTDEPTVRAEAARSLQRLHNPEAVDALVDATKIDTEPEASVRAEAAHALGQYAQSKVVQALIAALTDPSLAVNRNALVSLETLTGQNLALDTRAWLGWTERAGESVFAGRRPYVYPTFERDPTLLEYLPIVPGPPNEAPSTPVGLPPQTP